MDNFLNVATLFDELGIVTNAAVVRNGEISQNLILTDRVLL